MKVLSNTTLLDADILCVYISSLGFQTSRIFQQIIFSFSHNLPCFSYMSSGLITAPGAPQ